MEPLTCVLHTPSLTGLEFLTHCLAVTSGVRQPCKGHGTGYRAVDSPWHPVFQIPFKEFFTAEFQSTRFMFLLQIGSIDVDVSQDWKEPWNMIVQCLWQ